MTNLYNTERGNNYTSDSIRKLELKNAHEQFQLKEKYAHEERMEQIRNESTNKEAQRNHEKDMANQALGSFGRIFGAKENSSRNITGLICLSFVTGATLVSLLVYFCKEDLIFVKYMWGVTSPIITLSLGYLFGHKR